MSTYSGGRAGWLVTGRLLVRFLAHSSLLDYQAGSVAALHTQQLYCLACVKPRVKSPVVTDLFLIAVKKDNVLIKVTCFESHRRT